MPRKTWEEYYMGIANQVATRATCDRKHVGAILVKSGRILSTGYNGSIAGMPHCDEAGHDMVDGHCIRTIHAEVNAIIQAAQNGVSIDGAVLYSTTSPCWPCFKMIANAGIKKVIYEENYRFDKERINEVITKKGMTIVFMKGMINVLT